MTKSGRNDPCPCGSGKKYKKCCGQNQKVSKHSFTHLTSSKIQSNMQEISKKAIPSFGPTFQKNSEDKTQTLTTRFTLGEPPKKDEKSSDEKQKKEIEENKK